MNVGAGASEARRRRSVAMDHRLAAVFDAAAGGSEGFALVAVGGYGRAELAPKSDLDVVLVHDPKVNADKVAAVAEALIDWLAARFDWVRPVLDFAHLHAVTDGGFTDVDAFAGVLEAADGVMEPGDPFHVHFSDIAFANRNETKHLPYGEGTLRAEPLRTALRRFKRPATIISESPNEESHQAVKAILAPSRARTG